MSASFCSGRWLQARILSWGHAALSGRRAGMAAALGIALGVFVWAVVAAIGVAGLLAASALAFSAVKFLGAAYLTFLGIKSWLSAARGGERQPLDLLGNAVSGGQALRQGLLTNLFNPKAGMFFVALMPQFVPEHSPWVPTLLLSATAVVLRAHGVVVRLRGQRRWRAAPPVLVAEGSSHHRRSRRDAADRAWSWAGDGGRAVIPACSRLDPETRCLSPTHGLRRTSGKL